MKYHLTLVPSWIASADNKVTDALSRFDIPFLASHFPHVVTVASLPNPVPNPLHDDHLIYWSKFPTQPLSPANLSSETFTYDLTVDDE